MPIVPSNAPLHQALQAYITASGLTKSAVAAEFGMSPMTIGRFLKTCKVVDSNRLKIESGLNRHGRWPPSGVTEIAKTDYTIDYDNVIKTLEFLLAAARQHAKRKLDK